MNADAAPQSAAVTAAAAAAAPAPPARATIGSLTRRMIVVAALWITLLLLIGGFALDRVLTTSIVRNFDNQLEYVLNAMITASEIGPDGEVLFNRPPADQRFIEPYSGVYSRSAGPAPTPFRRAPCGIAGCASPPATRICVCTSTTAASSPASRCGS